jgi:hypothetical protein
MEERATEGVVDSGDPSGRSPSGEQLFHSFFYRERSRRPQAGASLIELLAVAAIMALMATLLYSALPSLSNSAGRRGAVNILLNTFEYARIAALESGQTVYVGFADEDFPLPEMRYAAFLVFRETSEGERAAGAGNYVVLTKWTKLPKNVAFKRVTGSLISENGGQTFSGLNAALPTSQHDETFPSLAFNRTGAVEGGTSPVHLYLYEGYYAGQQDIQTRRGGDLFDKISVSRYTGRAQFDVTKTNVR